MLPSLGSGGHATGECKPCAFFYKKAGCASGRTCLFCPDAQRAFRAPPWAGRQRPNSRSELLFLLWFRLFSSSSSSCSVPACWDSSLARPLVRERGEEAPAARVEAAGPKHCGAGSGFLQNGRTALILSCVAPLSLSALSPRKDAVTAKPGLGFGPPTKAQTPVLTCAR